MNRARGFRQESRCLKLDEPDAVEVVDLVKRFGGKVVLDKVSLTVARGETVVIIGPSGSGKSTLCRTIIGLEPFESGRIRIGGLPFLTAGPRRVMRMQSYRELRRGLGMVFQHFTLFPNMTVLDNVCLAPTKVLGLKSTAARERGVEILERVGLGDKLNSFPAHLSGGQKQRAAIARELAMDRKVIIFDEVTSALDPELVREVLAVIRNLSESFGMTLIIVTHEMSFARTVADRVVFMDNGQVVEIGEPMPFFTSPVSTRARKFLEAIEF